MKTLRTAWVRLSIALSIIASAAGCAAVLGLEETSLKPASAGGSGGGADVGGSTSGQGGSTPAPMLRLLANPQRLAVPRGGSANVTIRLDRGDFTGTVNVTLGPLPNGVTGGKGTIPALADEVNVTIAATKTAPLGLITPSVHATGAADLLLPILVSDPPGTLDSTFSSDGVILEGTDGKTSAFFAVLAQPDGKIVAGGARGAGGWAIRRYQADGSPDATFNGNAAAVMPATGQLRGLALDPKDDRIIAAGSSTRSSTTEATVIRLNADGTPNAVFGNSGISIFDTVSYPQGSTALGVAVTPTSAVLVAGTANQGPDEVALLTQLDASGQPDGMFSGYRAEGRSSLSGIALDGSFIIAGGADRAVSPPRSMLVRLDGAGKIDKGFGVGGVASFNDGCVPRGMAMQPHGGFVLAGQDVTAGPSFCIGRATKDGVLDWHHDFAGGNSETFTSVVALSDDRVVAVGHGGGTYSQYAEVVRLSPKGGESDTSFAPNGTVTLEDPNTPQGYLYRFNATALQPDGRILVAGSKSSDGYALLRFWP